jgi:hypothetical protein
MDWDGARAARSQINQMLPRVIGIVRAAGIGGWPRAEGATDPGRPLGRIEVLHEIFSAGYTDGLEQEILDVVDMALGVYEGDRFLALGRTVNPFHYAGTALAFVARAPRRIFAALGLARRPRAGQLPDSNQATLEAISARLGAVEDLVDGRLAAAQDRQAVRHADYSRQLAELAERVDFAERVLARQPKRLEAPEDSDLPTPV